jgi:ribosomal protein L40E/cell division protein FtsN
MNWFGLLAYGLWAGADRRRRTVVVCARCETEQPRGTRFCRKCGGTSLLRASDFDVFQAQKRDAELKDLENRQRRNSAIKRINKLSTQPFCSNCNMGFDESTEFCAQCGANIRRQFTPDKVIFYTIKKEFPRLVNTMQDYSALKSSPIERGINGRVLALNVSQLWDAVNFRPQSRLLSRPLKSTTGLVIFCIGLIVIAAVSIFILLRFQDTSPRMPPSTERSRELVPSVGASPMNVDSPLSRDIFGGRNAVSTTETEAKNQATDASQAATDQLELEKEQAEEELRRRRDETKRIAEEAEIERIHRYAPEGIVYNLKAISIWHENGVSSFRPGTELKVIRQNTDGTLHVEKNGLATDIPANDVTKDRDLAASTRANDGKNQETLRRVGAQRAKAAADAALIKRYKNIKDSTEAREFLDSLSDEDRRIVIWAD